MAEVKVIPVYDKKKKRHGFVVGDKTTPIWIESQAKVEYNKQLKALQTQAVKDSTAKADIPEKLFKQLKDLKLNQGEAKASKDPVSERVIAKRITQVENELKKFDTQSPDEVPVESGKEKSGVLDKIAKGVSEWWGGSDENQEKDAFIENHIAQNKEAFVNRELEVPPENKTKPEIWYNKENMKRTNQWYEQRAEEAYAEEMKQTDPANLKQFIK